MEKQVKPRNPQAGTEAHDPRQTDFLGYSYWYNRYQKMGYILPYPISPPASFTRISAEEIEEHLISYSRAYAWNERLRYVYGDDEEVDPIEERAALIAWEREVEWFERQGIPDGAVIYDQVAEAWRLPPNWTIER